jgi:hypothetical protein
MRFVHHISKQGKTQRKSIDQSYKNTKMQQWWGSEGESPRVHDKKKVV